jgi:hypothetical protein
MVIQVNLSIQFRENAIHDTHQHYVNSEKICLFRKIWTSFQIKLTMPE